MQILPDHLDPPEHPDPNIALDRDAAAAQFGAMLDGHIADAEILAYLPALSARGERPSEIAGAALAMRARMRRVAAPDTAIDVCGTGGDNSQSLNISTAVAILVAACDIPVAKHGNRAASSRAGAADVLAAAGLNIANNVRLAEDLLGDLGLAFLFAPSYHPALGKFAPLRKKIGTRTIFNLLGPLVNPANVRRQLIGIAHPTLMECYATAVAQLGYERVLLVSGAEGLDEISIAEPTHMAWITNAQITHAMIAPEEVGLPRYPATALVGGDADYNAAALWHLLEGKTGAYRDAVLFNSAAALMVAGVARDWREGLEEAREALDKGLAHALFSCWIKQCQMPTDQTQDTAS